MGESIAIYQKCKVKVLVKGWSAIYARAEHLWSKNIMNNNRDVTRVITEFAARFPNRPPLCKKTIRYNVKKYQF